MRLIFNLFLGWWLTQYYRWMAEGKPLPQPSISVNPSNVVALGENISISCKKERNLEGTSTFYLQKVTPGERTIRNTMHNELEFHIFNVQQSHQGKYSCIYNLNSFWSPYSNIVSIIVRDQLYPSPSISIIPNGMIVLGKKATIQCKQEYFPTAHFNLFKKEALDAPANHVSNKQIAEFPIPSVQESDGGIYFCDYQIQWNKYSNFSNKIYINITDPSLTKPSIQIINEEQDAPEAIVSIQCKATETDLIFALLKSGKQIDCKAAEPGEKAVNFSHHWIKLEEIQNYTCQYKTRPFVWSVPSDPVERPWEGKSLITLWTSIAACLFFLTLLLLVLILILYRKRKKGVHLIQSKPVESNPCSKLILFRKKVKSVLFQQLLVLNWVQVTTTGSVATESNVPAKMHLNLPMEETPDEVSYATINHNSLKILYDTAPESCVYANVSPKSTKEIQ
ncbi:immunoglobulin superfamily member 1-like [Notechis scutatus]|uniref:immunoglobulin superfamily member 1-like n=1 Tax=Notechis scutatus TaxID=8663 RepID=UPI000E780499|nr:immunoglobulin superfamily member 1-like [Notechis scutatus]